MTAGSELPGVLVLAQHFHLKDGVGHGFTHNAFDLDDYHNNFYAGIHAANMAGTWQAIVNGFAGVRCQNGVLKFKPTIPKEWEEYAFRLKFKGALLEVCITKTEAKFTLVEGDEIAFTVRGKEVELKCGETYIL